MAAAIKGCHQEQEGCHADNSDDQGHAEPVLHLFWWSLTLKLHVSDAHLARKEKVTEQKMGSGSLSLRTPIHLRALPLGVWGACSTTLLSPFTLPSTCLQTRGSSAMRNSGTGDPRASKGQAPDPVCPSMRGRPLTSSSLSQSSFSDL